jgi:thymidylate synthase (FAD)
MGKMILIKPSTQVLAISGFALELIESAGRTCYKSEDKIGPESAMRFVQSIMKRGHESVIEHAVVTVRFVVDRGVSHEIVRHRLASYSQESTRYCDYDKQGMTFIVPPWVQVPPGVYDTRKSMSIGTNLCREWMAVMFDAEDRYKYLIQMGWKPEQARSVLPNSLKTEIVMTANLREWRHFFRLRTTPAAHPQMREVAIPLLAEFKNSIPVIFDDLLVTSKENKTNE